MPVVCIPHTALLYVHHRPQTELFSDVAALVVVFVSFTGHKAGQIQLQLTKQ